MNIPEQQTVDHPLDQQTLWRFNFEGRFLGFADREMGNRKYLHMDILGEQVQIKLPKELRIYVGLHLQPGDCIHVGGVGKLDPGTGRFKLKAHQINPIQVSAHCALPFTVSSSESTQNKRPKSKILVCQKSACLKRGGRELLHTLEQNLNEKNLKEYVEIERTGCLKQCSQAPNVMVMPGKEVHGKVKPEQAAGVLECLYRRRNRAENGTHCG
ncbi:MAG: (2Fe-2S) ferredoxin domain-containing protein [Leptolyngbyaceae cyanobacterium bins.59]|nr:(2Fe-2S) ferredoxin domain-containing protein [Leptolyngbyaceae cyanobacterium bins.59]